MRPPRSRSRLSLTPAQRSHILAVAAMLPPAKRHSFTIRVEAKLATRRPVTDGLIAQVVDNVLAEIMTRAA